MGYLKISGYDIPGMSCALVVLILTHSSSRFSYKQEDSLDDKIFDDLGK